MPSPASNPTDNGIRKRSLSAWPGVGGHACESVSSNAARGGVVAAAAARRGVPACEYQRLNCAGGAVEALGLASAIACDEIVAGHGLAVVALEVQVHARAEAVAADQRLHHAHDLGALLVDGGGVEVVDLQVAVGPHRVRHRAGVFGELRRAQRPHVLDALH